MKKKILLIITVFTFYIEANCQITQGNWLVGGNASIETQKEKLYSSDITGWLVKVSPDIGYFIFDKTAAGIKANLNYSHVKTDGYSSKSTFLGLGPFVRYYFLPGENRINIFGESRYQYSIDFNGHNQNNFIFSAGPVIYFNNSVGLEFALNYEILNGTISNASTKTISFDIGFQIHLERDKNL